jgi:hypothetical protein
MRVFDLPKARPSSSTHGALQHRGSARPGSWGEPPWSALERDSSAPTSGTRKAGFGRGDDAHHDGG